MVPAEDPRPDLPGWDNGRTMTEKAATTRPAEPTRRRRRRRLRRLLAPAVAVLLAIWLGAAWYFSDVLHADAFAITPPAAVPETDVEVLAVAADRITLTAGADVPTEVTAPGAWGLWWEGGYGTLTQVAERDDDAVTRAFRLEHGQAPSPGTPADVDKYLYGDTPDHVLGLAWEPMTVPTELGGQDAWFVPTPSDEPVPWGILVHGKSADRDEMLRMLRTFHAEGLPTLVVTYRGDRDHPVDPSGRYGYGSTEWADLDAAVDVALAAGADGVVLGGASTGAALIGAWYDRSDAADAAVGIVLDAPNADVERTFHYVAGQRTVPGTSIPLPPGLAWTAFRLAELRFGVDLGGLDVSDTLAAVDVPVLVFHGDGDLRVPVEASRDLVAARADAGLAVTYVETDADEHVGSYNHDPPAYRDALSTFLQDVVP